MNHGKFGTFSDLFFLDSLGFLEISDVVCLGDFSNKLCGPPGSVSTPVN